MVVVVAGPAPDALVVGVVVAGGPPGTVVAVPAAAGALVDVVLPVEPVVVVVPSLAGGQLVLHLPRRSGAAGRLPVTCPLTMDTATLASTTAATPAANHAAT